MEFTDLTKAEKQSGYNNDMNPKTIKEYTILFQYLLLLKEPTYIFLVQVFQHLSPSRWWEEYIRPVLQLETKDNFKYLDISDLLNVMKVNWVIIFSYLDKRFNRNKYENKYKLVSKIHQIRTIIAHANEIDMSPAIFIDSLSYLLDYAKLIKTDKALIEKLEYDLLKYRSALPKEPPEINDEKLLMEKILAVIENKVLFKALSCETLPPDIKLSIDRTILRLRSMRTLDDLKGFFTGSLQSDRGQTVQKELHRNGLPGFEDIKDEIYAIVMI